MKKFLAIVLTFVLCFGVLSVALAAEDDAATAVPDGYTGIYTAEDLDNIRNNLSGKYILMNNIDLSSYENWSPIGTRETPFTGDLDGNGYVIKNMKIHKECSDGEEPCFGLFSSVDSSTINGLMLLNVDINVKFTGETPESFGIGSISGYAKAATFDNCITSGNITIDGFDEGVVGGISGTGISSELTNCVNNTKINLSTEDVYDICIGGIFGRATRTTINQTLNSGDITVSGTDSEQKARKLKIGGLAADFGNFHLVINDCYNKGNISINFSTPSTYIGGIMGDGYAIERCYNIGSITVPETFSGSEGGLAGNFHSTWLVTYPAAIIRNAYYGNENLYPAYIDEDSVPSDDYFTNVKYLTPEEMKKQESFVGFDFDAVWEMEENGYPVLKNMPVIPETEKPGVTKPTTTEPTTTKTDSAVPDGYIGIYTAEDLDNIRNNLSGKYILMNNIDLSSYENWSPIGSYEAPFTGELDGNGYSVENMTIANSNYAGLFGVMQNAIIGNLTVNNGKINIISDESVYAGMICGKAGNSTITDCVSSGLIEIETKAYAYIGGIAGVVDGKAERCQNNANVSVTVSDKNETSAYVGGVFGILECNAEQLCNNGNVTVISNLYQKLKYIYVGGIAGRSIYGTVKNSYNTGDLTENANQKYVYIGGISGYSFTVINCYNYGEISASSTEADVGAITGHTQLLASDFPSMLEPKNKLENCYYLDNISVASTFDFEELIINVNSLTKDEFKNSDSFIGFDFENVWKIDNELGRPVFKEKTEIESTTPSTEISTETTTTPVTEPSTEESTTIPVATPVEPSTTEPTTEEHTTKPVATPIEPSTTQPTTATTEPSTEPTTAEVVTTVKPTETVTNPVTEPSTAGGTTQPSTATTQPVTKTEPTTEPSTTNTTEPSTVTTTEPSTEPSTEPDDSGILEWFIKMLKAIIDFVVRIFVMLGC